MAMLHRNSRLVVRRCLIGLALALGPLLGACGPAVPSTPSFDVDIKPIMLARCVRCHGGGDCVQGEKGLTATNGFFDHYEDRGQCGADGGAFSPPVANDPCLTMSCRRGLRYYVDQIGGSVLTWDINYRIHLDNSSRMPPPPATKLTDRQFEILGRWFANPIEHPAP
jgi:hypothetical protein